MKADISRDTFDADKRFATVVHQQGRMLVGADLNEAQRILSHRIERGAADVIGRCGAPIGAAGFEVSTDGSVLEIGPGDYYVDGIRVVNPDTVDLTDQPADPGVAWPPTEGAGRHQVVLDVWHRLVTALDDPSIREVALGGPDTAARSRTLWQVRVVPASDGESCLSPPPDLGATTGQMAARANPEATDVGPCEVPPRAGFTGLENQLYRIEVHRAGPSYDLATAPDVVTVTGFPAGSTDQVVVDDVTGLSPGDAVELFPSAPGADADDAQLAHVTAIDDDVLTLDSDLATFALDDAPRLRRVEATFLWSRDNGSVVTTIEHLDGAEVTVADLGPDDVRGLAPGQWVEITDDGHELEGRPGQLRRIDRLDLARRLVVLKTAPDGSGIDLDRRPRLRRWDGAHAILHGGADQRWIDIEDGVSVRFTDGSYRTHDWWQIPARTATVDPLSGTIAWPHASGQPALRLPHGVTHHACRLAFVDLTTTDDGAVMVDDVIDCRRLFPPITELTTLLHVGGDGQEGVPDPADPDSTDVRLPALLRARVATGGHKVEGARVRFELQDRTNGRMVDETAPLVLDAVSGPDGVVECDWRLHGGTAHQTCRARLLDAAGDPLDHQVVHFEATLSTATRVAYDPRRCDELEEAGVATVQEAIDALCRRGPVEPERPDLPRIEEMSWPHAGEMGLDQLVEEGLFVQFDRPLLEPEGPGIGWFLVSFEYDRTQFEADPN